MEKRFTSSKCKELSCVTILKLLLDSNDSSKATFHLNKAVSLMPQNFQTRIKVAEMLREKGMLDQALTLYKEASSLQSNNSEVLSTLGNIYFQKGDLVKASKMYKQSVKKNPKTA